VPEQIESRRREAERLPAEAGPDREQEHRSGPLDATDACKAP